MSGLLRAQDGWVLPVDGASVDQIAFDFAVTLLLSGPITIRVEAPLSLDGPDLARTVLVPGESMVRMAPLLALHGGVVDAGRAGDDGSLQLSFNDGRFVSVASGEDYEPWVLSGPSGLLVVSVPGGGLTIWGPDGSERGQES